MRVAVVGAALGVAIFVALGTFIRWGDHLPWVDRVVHDWVLKHRDKDVVKVLKAISKPGGGSWVPVCSSVVAALTIIVGLWSLRRRPAGSRVARHRIVLGPAIYLAIVIVGSEVLNATLKAWVDRPRPTDRPIPTRTAAFPSGHAQASSTMWAAIAVVLVLTVATIWPTRTTLIRRVRRTLAVLAATIAVVVAASRVLLGVHWVTDVLAGLTVGWTWFTVVTLLTERWLLGASLAQFSPLGSQRS